MLDLLLMPSEADQPHLSYEKVGIFTEASGLPTFWTARFIRQMKSSRSFPPHLEFILSNLWDDCFN